MLSLFGLIGMNSEWGIFQLSALIQIQEIGHIIREIGNIREITYFRLISYFQEIGYFRGIDNFRNSKIAYFSKIA